TNARRLKQLIGYYETALGKPWPDLLDAVAGGGAVFAAKIGPDGGVMLVIQGKNEALDKMFAQLGLKVIEQELARLEAKPALKKAHESADGKELFRSPRDNFQATVLAGGVLDVVGRSPFVCTALHQQADKLVFSVRLPCGREGMAPGLTTHVPPPQFKGILP